MTHAQLEDIAHMYMQVSGGSGWLIDPNHDQVTFTAPNGTVTHSTKYLLEWAQFYKGTPYKSGSNLPDEHIPYKSTPPDKPTLPKSLREVYQPSAAFLENRKGPKSHHTYNNYAIPTFNAEQVKLMQSFALKPKKEPQP